MANNRLNPKIRIDKILRGAVNIARDEGFQSITREKVAVQCGISPPLITYYFGAVESLKNHVISWGVDNEDLEIIAQGLAARHETALNASKELKAKALEHLSSV